MTPNSIIIFFFLTFSFISFSQKEKQETTTADHPFIIGQVNELFSKSLQEKRTLNIYLPEGYNPKDSITYPVIYLLDGSADEDFIHIAGLIQFNSFEWVNRVPKSIVVGIATVDRKRDFTFPTTVQQDKKRFPTTGGSAAFISFIKDELQPFIAKKYKTRANKTIMGQSLGGLLITELLFSMPDSFDNYIIISPSLWWDNGSLLSKPIETLRHKNIYIGVGKEGLTPSDPPRMMEVDANLLAEKITLLNFPSVQCYFEYFPEENHATIFHQAVNNAFKHVFNK